MRILFTITLFLSSMLLFLIEPMIAKMILPRFGGTPEVWNTSLVFFQAALLAGYGYAHLATKWLGPRVQALTHIAVLLLPLIALPFALPSGIETGRGDPAPLVLLILAISVGLPFFVVSAGAPLLQRWFAATKDPHAHDPYFLYSASNVGSLLALLSYPFFFEPRFALSVQARIWTYGYYGLITLMALCALVLWLKHGTDEAIHEAPPTMPPEVEGSARQPISPSAHQPIAWQRRLFWIGLAFCPSSLLLGVTTYLTSNIAPIPLLWVVPLALYLVTFIIAFARKPVVSSALLGRILPLLVIPLAFTLVLEASDPSLILPLSLLHLATVFVASLFCHCRLAEDRPSARHLTEFFFYVSLGGVLGGVFNALIAPTIFNSLFEYPLVLALACFFRRAPLRRVRRQVQDAPKRWGFSLDVWDILYPLGFIVATILIILIAKYYMPDPSEKRSFIAIGIPLILAFILVDRPFRFATSLIAYFVITGITQVASGSDIILARRSFFGVHRVEQYSNMYGLFHGLLHGNTVHGKENMDEKVHATLTPREQRAVQLTPLTYYYPSGPIGQVFVTLGPRFHNVALVGLGIGSLAAYGLPGQNMTFYEIDPDVIQLASDPKLFRFVHDCRAHLNIVLGDARLELAKAPASSYDLIALDAFSSDSIPMHLLTQEALQMYLSKLAPGGVIVFHISNRYLDLQPVLASEAAAAGLYAWVDDDFEVDMYKAKSASIWVAMARNPSDVRALLAGSPDWDPISPDPGFPVWTDDYSNILSVLKVGRRQGE